MNHLQRARAPVGNCQSCPSKHWNRNIGIRGPFAETISTMKFELTFGYMPTRLYSIYLYTPQNKKYTGTLVSKTAGARPGSAEISFSTPNHELEEGDYFVTFYLSGYTSGSPVKICSKSPLPIECESVLIPTSRIGFRLQLVKPELQDAIPAAPRYQIISPAMQGYYTESVREISAGEVSRLRSRGFKVNQVSGSIPISGPIKTRVGTVPRRMAISRPRMGLGYRRATNTHTRRTLTSFIPKSSRNPRQAFAEPRYSVRRLTQGGLVFDYINQSLGSTEYFVRNGFKLYNVIVRDLPAGTQNIERPVTGTVATYWKRGKKLRGTTILPHLPSQAPPAPTPGIPQPPAAPVNYGTSQEDKDKIAALEAQLQELNRRASQQLVDLGNSTTDRSNEIRDLQNNITALNERVSQQLIDLGNAVSDASKAVTEKNIQDELDNAGKGLGGVWEGLTGFITQPTNLLLIGGALLILIMVLKR